MATRLPCSEMNSLILHHSAQINKKIKTKTNENKKFQNNIAQERKKIFSNLNLQLREVREMLMNDKNKSHGYLSK